MRPGASAGRNCPEPPPWPTVRPWAARQDHALRTARRTQPTRSISRRDSRRTLCTMQPYRRRTRQGNRPRPERDRRTLLRAAAEASRLQRRRRAVGFRRPEGAPDAPRTRGPSLHQLPARQGRWALRLGLRGQGAAIPGSRRRSLSFRQRRPDPRGRPGRRRRSPYVYDDEVAADVKAGRLTRILEKWCPAFPGYYLYHPSRRQTPPALTALIAALRHKFSLRHGR